MKKHTKQELERGYTDRDFFSATVVLISIMMAFVLIIVGAITG
mgnify:CR=1 FL=1